MSRPDLPHLELGIAATAHQGQADKAGQPYLWHPIRVAEALAERGASRDAVAAALLHDVLEDTPLGVADLLAKGVSPAVVATVEALTRREGEAYRDYVLRVKHRGGDAVSVKLADLADNWSRLHALPAADALRLRQRYAWAITALGFEEEPE